jgi:hypothetical protein
MSSMKEKMHTGELYFPGDQEIVEDQTKRGFVKRNAGRGGRRMLH